MHCRLECPRAPSPPRSYPSSTQQLRDYMTPCGGEYLQPNGTPSICVINLANDAFSLAILPFCLWSLYTNSRKPRISPSKLRLAGFLAGSTAIFGQKPLQFACMLPMLLDEWFQLQRSPICGGQQLNFYLFQTLLLITGYPASWRLYANIACALAFLLELSGSNNKPLGYETATIFSKISNSYLSHMLKTSRTGQLSREDFADCPKELDTAQAYQDVSGYLDYYNYQCIWALMSYNKWRMVLSTILEVLSTVCAYSRPYILGSFLASLARYTAGEQTIYPSIYLATLFAILQLTTPALGTLTQNVNSVIGGTSGAALTEAIYRKTARLSNESRQVYDSAKIMNLLNVDAAIVRGAYDYFPTLIDAPVGLLVCTWQLYVFIGKSSLAAVPVYAFFIPYSSWYMKTIYTFFPQLMKAKDKRTKSLWGLLRNIKSLKLYSWEEPYESRVDSDRTAELNIQKRSWRLSSVYRCVSMMMDDVVASCVFIAYIWYSGKALTPEIVFPTLSLLSFLGDPFTAFPAAISGLGRAFTSQRRLQEFFLRDEHVSKNYHLADKSADFALDIQGASLSWNESSSANAVVKELTLRLGAGDLCCIVGRVGTGKTAILRAICDQMNIVSGSITLAGTIGYCPQEPWLQYKTVRENILFGLKFEEEFYQRTIEACELLADIKSLPSGDLTQVGEKGICLSGGQKARVSLARAVYSRADVVVLDDVLSAVDEHVSRNLVTNLFSHTGLLAGKTVVLATNSALVLRHASVIVNLATDGTYKIDNHFGGDNGSVATSTATTAISTPAEPTPGESTPVESTSEPFEYKLPAGKFTRDLLPESNRFKTVHSCGNIPDPILGPAFDFQAIEEQLADEQKDQKAEVSKVMLRYLQSAGWGTLALFVVAFISSILAPNLILIWLTIWSDKRLSSIEESRFYVIIYLCLSGITGLSVFFSFYIFYGFVVTNASLSLHAKMVKTVLESPMTFFDTTPMGSIMNRFTGDISTLDSSVPNTLLGFCRTAMMGVASFVITLVGAPVLIAVVVPLLLLYNNFRQSYIPCSRQVQRISSAFRSPILSHIEESIKGVATVKAFDRWPQFIEAYQVRSDYWMDSVFLRSALSRWLGWRVRLITVTIIWFAAMSLIFLAHHSTYFTVGLAGIVMHSTQRTGVYLARIIRSAAGMEISAVAVERVFEYCDLKTEAARDTAKDPKNKWPPQGSIQFKDYSARYRETLPIVLKNISIEIKPQEKIGVVGRTGAAKSTLCLAIFRIIEAATGGIEIDATKINELGLRALRRNLSIIPQDAQIFAGTLRDNLSPFDEFDDEKLRNILRLCHLENHFYNVLGTGLDSELLEGGENISRGQAQLICLGRALLHDSPILVLDEATASVDTETDAIVQQTIRTEFKKKTIVTIAHRLNTIMDCDRILVLDKGEVKEFDTPENLLAAKGTFYSLAQHPEELA